MTRPLFQLGSFQFDLPNGAPQTLDWGASYRWEEQDRILRDPAVQFVGPGSQVITLNGVLFPGFSGRQGTMEQLRGIAREGQPLMLTDGLGKVYGKWAIKGLREGKGTFAPGGGARQIDFNVELVFYGEDNPGLAASPLSIAPGSGLAQGATQAIGETAFKAAGSAFDLTTVAFRPGTQLLGQATGAGFGIGQLASIAQAAGSGDYVGAVLSAFGLTGLDAAQQGVWAQRGIQAAQMVQAMAAGDGPPAMSVALGFLRGADGSVFEALAGNGAPGLAQVVESAATVSTLLDIDPKFTGIVREAITL